MKNILLACAPSRIDSPLRRSLVHLAKSCQIVVAHDGYLVFEELYAKAFDLIIIDFVISGVDSLELVESIQYIDPGVPVILMIPQAHQAIANTAHRLKAQPIIRPFKPLSFLRLVDQLLHQQLNRYRQLATTLQNTVGMLRALTSAACVFLVEETGHLLVTSGEVKSISLEALSSLTIESYVQAKEREGSLSYQNKNLYISTGDEEAYRLYTTVVAENLYLALIMAVTAHSPQADAIWPKLDQAAREMRQAFQSQTGVEVLEKEPADLALNRFFIPLKLSGDPISGDELAGQTTDAANGVNWQIITQAPALSNRLQEFCRVD